MTAPLRFPRLTPPTPSDLAWLAYLPQLHEEAARAQPRLTLTPHVSSKAGFRRRG